MADDEKDVAPDEQEPVVEDLGIDIGDLPEAPPTAVAAITDAFAYNVAFNFAFVGVGQGGGRIASVFRDYGYRRVCAINTTVADLSDLKLPAKCKLDIGEASGAGKDPAVAAQLADDKDEEIFDLLKRSWGDEVDYVFVCFGAAGGTGAGASAKVIDVATRYMEETKRPVKVGVICALPKDSEGQRFAKNALHTARFLKEVGDLSPVIFVDNQKIKSMYDPPASKEYDVANNSTAKLLHLFNRMAGTDSALEAFDRADFARLLDNGVVAFGSDTITKWDDPSDISGAIRDKLKRNLLATVDLSKGRLAGMLYILAGAAYDEVKTSYLEHGQEMMTRILADDSTVFRGVYKGQGASSIKMLAMVSALPWPRARLEELAKRAGSTKDEVAKILGV